MDLQGRKNALIHLRKIISDSPENWQIACRRAEEENRWFTQPFIQLAVQNICDAFLTEEALNSLIKHYSLNDSISPKTIGIVMAGNIPLVGFHDFLCVYLSGHHQLIKLSEKDKALMTAIVNMLHSLDADSKESVRIAEKLSGCDAYIATGSNNTGRYFEQYFGKYPHIIRKNKTSVAILDGTESKSELEDLSTDIHQYFGFGCRNITKLYVPHQYDFTALINAFNNYAHLKDHTKYANNFEYQLSIVILNNKFYMTNGTTLLTENEGMFSPPAHIWFEYYENKDALVSLLKQDEGVQIICGHGLIPFGDAQKPGIMDYADGEDTMAFLLSL